MESCLGSVTAAFTENVNTYPEYQHGFHLFGVDFLVDSSNRVYLLEINAKPGISFNEESNRQVFSESMFDWLNDVLFFPVFSDFASSSKPLYSGRVMSRKR
jgi:Tubulin-tyrosine ligase family